MVLADVSEVFRLQLAERAPGMVEARAVGLAYATSPLPFALDELEGLLADGEFMRVGQALYDVLFPEGEVRDALAEALVATRARRQPLLVQLHLDDSSPILARYPWELIYDGQTFPVADGVLALARYIDDAQGLVSTTVDAPLRVLLAVPRPVDLAEAGEDAGSPALAALDALRRQGMVQVDLLTPPTFAALRQTLSRGDHQVFHFEGASGWGQQGSGTEAGYLVFEDEYGAAQPVDGPTLRNALFLSPVRLVVLTPPDTGPRCNPAPLGGLAPALIRSGVPAVVAMQYGLPAEQSEHFVAQFYSSVAALAPLGTAVAHARGQLLPPESTRFAPALYLQDKEGQGLLFQRAGEPAGGPHRAQPLGHVPAAPGRFSAGYRPEPVFVDRAQLVQEALRALAGPGQRVCLWGLGGVGKTAVAREVARRSAWRFPAGVIWLSLQGGRSLAALLPEIAAFYEAKLSPRLEEAAPQAVALLAEQVAARGGEALLVLDNLEDAAADPDLAAFLDALPAGASQQAAGSSLGLPAAGVRVLATSRCEPDGGSWQTLELRAMDARDIERILRRKVALQRIIVPAADEPLLGEISALLDGYPLGVDLVVSLARTCPWAHIRDQLRAEPPPPLQAILKTTVHEGLGEGDRRLAARMSVLRGRFDETAITRLGGVQRWLPHVQRLRELALLSFDGATYGFDVPVREYLYAQLSPDEARACHERAYRYFAARKDLDGKVEAYQHALAAGRHEAARDLLRDKLMAPLLDAGRYRQLLSLLGAALSIPEAFDERFLLQRARVQRILGQFPEALSTLEELLTQPALEPPTRALALHEQGRICYELDDEAHGGYERALELYGEAIALCEELAAGQPDRSRRRWLDAEMAALYQDVALVYQYALAHPQDMAFAHQLYRTSAGLWQRLRDPVSRAISETQRAEILRQGSTDEKNEAKRIYRAVMQTFRRKGLERHYSEALLQLGKLYYRERSLKHALNRFQEYEEIQRRLGLGREEAMAWKQQAAVYQEAGYRGRSLKQAVDLYTRALERLEACHDRWSRRAVISGLLRRGEAYLELRQPALAQADFRQAMDRSFALGAWSGRFDIERLSASDRRRLVWAQCALAHINGEGEEAEGICDNLPVSAAAYRSLGFDAPGVSIQEIDCSALGPLPKWVVHHDSQISKA